MVFATRPARAGMTLTWNLAPRLRGSLVWFGLVWLAAAAVVLLVGLGVLA